MQTNFSRRDVLKAVIAGSVCLGTNFIASKSHAALTSITLDQCSAMSISEIASSSGEVMAAWEYLNKAAHEIRNPAIRRSVIEIISNPNPSLLHACDTKEVLKALKAHNFVAQDATTFLPNAKDGDTALQPFYTAPGSGYGSHHAYPGGLVTHTGLNVKMAIDMHKNYSDTYNMHADRDIVIAAQILHDLHKPWVFQWESDNASRTEQVLAGTGEHHVLSLAESIHRGLPAKVIIAQAGAHIHPGTPETEAQMVNWLTAAAIIVGKDAIALGLVAQDGKTLPQPRGVEAFITHVADHDYVLSVPSVKWLLPVMKKIAQECYGIQGADLEGKVYNNLRNYIFAQVTAMTLYHHYTQYGEKGVRDYMLQIVRV
ncbi:MAG: metal-dependent phosphohydrolase [Pseudomonadota bacterium]